MHLVSDDILDGQLALTMLSPRCRTTATHEKRRELRQRLSLGLSLGLSFRKRDSEPIQACFHLDSTEHCRTGW
jgi:hypothetical protein